MKLSIIVPAYNEEVLIGTCISSILDSIHATHCDAEVIISNNASTDRTEEIARSYGEVHVVNETRKGITYARQAGFDASTGDLIANIDADTKMSPEWIRTVMSAFKKDPHLVAMSGPYIYYDLSLFQRTLVALFYQLAYILHFINTLLGKGAMLQGGNYVVTRDALQKIGGFDTSISFYGEDTDIAKRISSQGTVLWSFKLSLQTSGRRLKEEGLVRMSWKYAMNHISILYFNTVATKEYRDIRPKG